MGADYYLDVKCDVRKELDNEGIILMKKQIYALDSISQNNPEVTDDYVVKGVRQVGHEITEYSMTIADLKKIRDRHNNLRDNYCNQCKYNIDADAMGCMGRINYPIPMQNELLIFSTIIDNLQTVGEMKDPFIRSLVDDYPSALPTRAIAMYRMRGMMFQNRMPVQTSPDVSKNLISSDFIWASYLLPHDSELPFGKESESDKILIEYSGKTLERLYNHAKFMTQQLANKLEDTEISKNPQLAAEIENMQKYYKFVQFAHEDKVTFFMFP